ncbi:MAG: LuxR family transcriptional regulator [Burkholderiales bacterium]|jgi:DNA-binding CsgD family transcriptional regulator|nr:LuxR family transcriptional regulator [Burkholderiales bacterium]
MIGSSNLDLLDRIDRAKSVTHLRMALVDFLPMLDIQHAAYCGVPPLVENDTREWIVLVTYPDAWVRHYTQEDYFRIDPVVQAAMRQFMPIDWHDLSQSDPVSSKIFSEAASFGIGRQGLAFPIRGPRGDFALFNVTSGCDDPAWEALKERRTGDWMTLGHYIHRRLLDIAGAKMSGGVARLSPRETETLQLTASGLTSDVVAERMGISERVVRAHLQTCRYKLNALNTTHAVARAVKLGVIPSE